MDFLGLRLGLDGEGRTFKELSEAFSLCNFFGSSIVCFSLTRGLSVCDCEGRLVSSALELGSMVGLDRDFSGGWLKDSGTSLLISNSFTDTSWLRGKVSFDC